MSNFNFNHGIGVSSKYVAINTANMVSQFEAAGFQLQSSSAALVRNPARNGYQKHILKFTHPDLVAKSTSDIVPQIVLRNSYDGSSSFNLFLGVFRLVCSNGLMVGTAWESVRVRHVGQDALRRAVDGAFRVAAQVETLTAKIDSMKARQLTNDEIQHFGARASELILPDEALTRIETILQPRRAEDTANDLWSIFNRVQENSMRGGVQYTTVNALNQVRRNSTRSIRSIDRSVKVNQDLWALAESMLVG